jgi:amino-acid N-acetyltransferase
VLRIGLLRGWGVIIARIGPDVGPEATALLSASALPIDDLTRSGPILLGARDEKGLVGIVGVERAGSAGLLRSLAVRPDLRGTGLGSQLTTAAEALAVELGIGELYLLTTTAEAFFLRRGYTRLPREAAPSAIRGTTEFASLCPDSAAFMSKKLHAD